MMQSLISNSTGEAVTEPVKYKGERSEGKWMWEDGGRQLDVSLFTRCNAAMKHIWQRDTLRGKSQNKNIKIKSQKAWKKQRKTNKNKKGGKGKSEGCGRGQEGKITKQVPGWSG
jgi:hypothetical protein